MTEVDQLIETASAKWFAYGVLMGKHKTREGSKATCIVSVYIDKYTPIQRKFQGENLAAIVEEIKKFLADHSYVQLPGSIDKTGKPKKFSDLKKETQFNAFTND